MTVEAEFDEEDWGSVATRTYLVSNWWRGKCTIHNMRGFTDLGAATEYARKLNKEGVPGIKVYELFDRYKPKLLRVTL